MEANGRVVPNNLLDDDKGRFIDGLGRWSVDTIMEATF